MIVTIDGPSGAGKSTAARGLAGRLGFEFLDTGAMFRALALAVLRGGVDPDDPPALNALLAEVRLAVAPGRVFLGPEDVTALIRTADVSEMASRVGVIPAVRARLAEQQRAVAAGRDIVCEGRDQGTVVFPDAGCKFFLVANPEERARRRHRELLKRGEAVTFEEVLGAQLTRDRRDSSREVAPLTPAADAVVIDTTHLTPESLLDRLEAEVRRCRAG